MNQGKSFQKILRGMSVRQKLGLILEAKVAQKLSLEKEKILEKKRILLKNVLLNRYS